MKIVGASEIFIGVLLLLLAVWSFLWIFSSSHLAHDFCNGQFSLFHEQFRCKQPFVAMLLSFGSICGAVTALVFGVLHVRFSNSSGT